MLDIIKIVYTTNEYDCNVACVKDVNCKGFVWSKNVEQNGNKRKHCELKDGVNMIFSTDRSDTVSAINPCP